MAEALTPTAPVRFCLARLRQAVASEARFTDQDLLNWVNEAYRSAAESSGCFQAIATITFDPDTTEAPLPTDHARTIRVYQAGRKLEPVDLQHAARHIEQSYYQFEGVIGVAHATPSVTMLYARLPAVLGYDSTPEWGTEWNYLLRHYTAWRCVLASGGAQTTAKAVREYQAYKIGVALLRRQSQRGWHSGLTRVRHVSQNRGAPVAG